MALHLALHVLDQLVDRVHHLRCGLPGAQGNALELQRRFSHLAVGNRGVPLLGQLDVESRQLRYLPADPAKALLDVLPELLGDLDVPTADLDAHVLLLARQKFPNGTPPRAMRKQAQPALAKLTAATRREPPRRSAAAQAARVAPVVCTSSTRTAIPGAGATSATTGARASLSRRGRPTWGGPSRRARHGASSSPVRSASSSAICPAGSKPRLRRRERDAGTGTSVPQRTPGGARRAIAS